MLVESGFRGLTSEVGARLKISKTDYPFFNKQAYRHRGSSKWNDS